MRLTFGSVRHLAGVLVYLAFSLGCGDGSRAKNACASGTGRPCVTSITPEQGPPNTVITITGTGFGTQGPLSRIRVGLALAEVVSWSAHEIQARIPPFAAPGELKIKVSIGRADSNAVSFEHERPWLDTLTVDRIERTATVTGRYLGPRGTAKLGAESLDVVEWSAEGSRLRLPESLADGDSPLVLLPVAESPVVTNTQRVAGPGSMTRVDPGPGAMRASVRLWTGSEFFVWGGLGQYNPIFQGFRYNPRTNTWRVVSNEGAPMADPAIAVFTGAEILMWGGSRLRWDSSNDWVEWRETYDSGWRYDLAEDRWTPMSSRGAPSARTKAFGVWADGKMIVYGGLDAEYNRLADGGIYDPTTDSWTSLPTENAPGRRDDPVVAWTGQEMVVWGGSGTTTPIFTGAAYDPITNRWETLPAGPTISNPMGAWTSRGLWIWGHDADSEPDTVAKAQPGKGVLFSFENGAWNPLPNFGSPPLGYWQRAVVCDDFVVISGGGGIEGYSSPWGIFDLGSSTWETPESPKGLPRYTQPVWTGTDVLVWGGDNFTGGGAFLQPSSGLFFLSPTAATFRQAEKQWDQPVWFKHTGVWTGSEAILWGGNSISPDEANKAGFGLRYDPSRDQWKPVSRAEGAPSARTRHSAVWMGREMLIFGGDEPGSEGSPSVAPLATRYDPTTDTWRPVSTEGAPGQRTRALAVWTGGRAVIWGGHGIEYNAPADGALYDPIADTWSSMAQPGINELNWYQIAWSTPNVYLHANNRFVAYSPLANTWTVFPNVPPGLYGMTEENGIIYLTAESAQPVGDTYGSKLLVQRFDTAGQTWLAPIEFPFRNGESLQFADVRDDRIVAYARSTGGEAHGYRFHLASNKLVTFSVRPALYQGWYEGTAWTFLGDSYLYWPPNNTDTGGQGVAYRYFP